MSNQDNAVTPDKRQAYVDASDFTPNEHELIETAELPPGDPPPQVSKKRRGWLMLALLALIVAVVVETVLLIQASFAQHWLLGSLWLIGLGGLVLLGLRALIRELWLLRKLKQRWYRQKKWQVQPDSFSADKVLAELDRDDLTALWQNYDQTHWSPVEQQQRFEVDVLALADQQAQREISRFAGEGAVLVAASPSAILDMLVMLWRNQRMISRIAAIYGVRLGYWSRIRLWRQLLANIVYAGASEVIMDAGTVMLGAELAGKLSARAGQGLGAGLLTARLGLQAQRLCRPLPFVHNKQASLGRLQAQLLKQLAQRLPELYRSRSAKTAASVKVEK